MDQAQVPQPETISLQRGKQIMKKQSSTKQVFLSHARNDNDLANALAKELRSRGFKVWDDQSIGSGLDWSDQIKRALQDSDSMIALLNQHSYSSSYVRNELEYALFEDEYKNRLLPVFVGSTSDTEFVRLPWVLTKLEYLKLSERGSLDAKAIKIADRFSALLRSKRSDQ
ncbi:unnamed protein product [marine sediment metagenome]|uniref:TIR domain-containing protein n=1 Tax=marine sediment metagenome TaxID=412755 RepID=X0UD62_9ZZZZ